MNVDKRKREEVPTRKSVALNLAVLSYPSFCKTRTTAPSKASWREGKRHPQVWLPEGPWRSHRHTRHAISGHTAPRAHRESGRSSPAALAPRTSHGPFCLQLHAQQDPPTFSLS